MKFDFSIRKLVVPFLILAGFLLISSSYAQVDKDSLRIQIHKVVDEVDSLREAGQIDSAIVRGNIVLEKAEKEFKGFGVRY